MANISIRNLDSSIIALLDSIVEVENQKKEQLIYQNVFSKKQKNKKLSREELIKNILEEYAKKYFIGDLYQDMILNNNQLIERCITAVELNNDLLKKLDTLISEEVI